jgi:hypothetical protein
VKGGKPGPYYTSPCFPIYSHVTGGLMVSNHGLICRRTEVRISPKSKREIQKQLKFYNFKMGIASVTAISCGHMLHYIKLCLWGATILLMLSLISHMSTVALWSATRVAMPKVPGSKLGRTNSIFDKLNLKSFPS